jgi:hypothetical protein
MIATLNNRDRDYLFNMSFALLRRFAVIEVPVPGAAEYQIILSDLASTDIEEWNDGLAALAQLGSPPASYRDLTAGQASIGPAILIDLARYLREANPLIDETAPGDKDRFMLGGINAILANQWHHLKRPQLSELARFISENVVTSTSVRDVELSLEVALGVSITEAEEAL